MTEHVASLARTPSTTTTTTTTTTAYTRIDGADHDKENICPGWETTGAQSTGKYSSSKKWTADPESLRLAYPQDIDDEISELLEETSLDETPRRNGIVERTETIASNHGPILSFEAARARSTAAAANIGTGRRRILSSDHVSSDVPLHRVEDPEPRTPSVTRSRLISHEMTAENDDENVEDDEATQGTPVSRSPLMDITEVSHCIGTTVLRVHIYDAMCNLMRVLEMHSFGHVSNPRIFFASVTVPSALFCMSTFCSMLPASSKAVVRPPGRDATTPAERARAKRRARVLAERYASKPPLRMIMR